MAAKHSNTDTAKDSMPPPPILPFEIIEQILLRAPVKTLWRFRPVCKQWCSLISSSEFAQTHLSSSAIKTAEFDFNHRRLILVGGIHHHVVDCSMQSVGLNDPDFEFRDLDCPMKDWIRRYGVAIVGSCNGLVGLAIEKKILLWNPSIGKYRILPDSGFPYNVKNYGFGYDASTGDYKLVILRLFGSEIRGMVYRLKNDCWVRLEEFFCSGILNGSVEFINGVIYWATLCRMEKGLLVSFELETEKLREVMLPAAMGIPSGEGMDMMLGVLGGSLVVAAYTFLVKTEMWLLKKDGRGDSWTKLFVVPPIHLFFSISPKPLCILKDGRILLGDVFAESCFAMYDPQSDRIDCRISFPHNFYQMNTYVESLISPSPNKEVGRQGINAG